MGSTALDRLGLRLLSGGCSSSSRVSVHPPEGTLAYRRGTEDTVSPKATTPRFPESQDSPSLSSGSVVVGERALSLWPLALGTQQQDLLPTGRLRVDGPEVRPGV